MWFLEERLNRLLSYDFESHRVTLNGQILHPDVDMFVIWHTKLSICGSSSLFHDKTSQFLFQYGSRVSLASEE